MRGRFGVIVAAVMNLQMASVVADEALYETCATCHGAEASGNDLLSAPQLASQNASYLMEQLANFRSGARGSHLADANGQLMAANAKNLSDEQIQVLSTYLSRLPASPPPSQQGSRERGQQIYEDNCLACHGSDAAGVEPLVAPNLRILSAKYIESQLVAYEKGWRGGEGGTTRSKAMRSIVVQLNGPEDVRDLLAFLHE